MSNFFVKNKKYFLYSVFFFSFIVQSSDMNIQDIPSIVFNHSDDFLSEFSIPMPIPYGFQDGSRRQGSESPGA